MIKKESRKKVTTYDLNKKENGFLVELFKLDNDKTSVYLSCALPGAFKGFHLHKVREANYVCIRGKLKIIMYTKEGRVENTLSASDPEMLHIPINTPTGLCNDGDEEAWIINYPNPAFDPNLKDEQVDYTEQQCERGEHI